MLENITIKIEKNGKELKPSYGIILQGNGKIIYRGSSNIEPGGEIIDKISEDDFLEILSTFKEIDFFSFINKFQVDKNSSRPYTTISINLPIDKERSKTATITYHDDDSNVPKELIKLEKSIKNKVGTHKWINKKKYKPIKKKVQDIDKKDNTNLRKKVISSIIIAVVVFLVITTVFLFVLDNKNNSVEQTTQDNAPEITYISTTLSNKRNNGERASINDLFNPGDKVYVDFEYNKFFQDYNSLILEITVIVEEKVYYHNFSKVEAKPANIQDFYSIISFPTNKSWPSGQTYTVTLNITDITTGKSTHTSTTFNLGSSNNPSNGQLNAEITEVTVFDNLSIYFEGTATGGNGGYSYSWEFKNLDGDLIGTAEGEKGTYRFEEIQIVEIKLTASDNENEDTDTHLEYIK